jgi:hypothetical protein
MTAKGCYTGMMPGELTSSCIWSYSFNTLLRKTLSQLEIPVGNLACTSTGGHHSDLATEFRQLQRRYDALLVSKHRAAERYRADYKKWRRFKDFMCQEDDESASTGSQQPIERKLHQMASAWKKRKRFKELAVNHSHAHSPAAATSSSFGPPSSLHQNQDLSDNGSLPLDFTVILSRI